MMGERPLFPGLVHNDGIAYESLIVLNAVGLRAIKERVRSAILDWSLELGKKGIHGEGMSFRPDEVAAAKTIQHITIFNGAVSGGATVQNVGEGTANAAIGLRLAEVADLVRTIRSQMGTLNLNGEEVAEVTRALKRLEEGSTDKKPDRSNLLAGLTVLNAVFGTVKAAKEALPSFLPAIEHLIQWVHRLGH